MTYGSVIKAQGNTAKSHKSSPLIAARPGTRASNNGGPIPRQSACACHCVSDLVLPSAAADLSAGHATIMWRSNTDHEASLHPSLIARAPRTIICMMVMAVPIVPPAYRNVERLCHSPSTGLRMTPVLPSSTAPPEPCTAPVLYPAGASWPRWTLNHASLVRSSCPINASLTTSTSDLHVHAVSRSEASRVRNRSTLS